MNRKHFLSSLAGSSLIPALDWRRPSSGNEKLREANTFIIPPYLRVGDTVGITCPAGFMTLKDIQPAKNTLETWGYKLRLGSTVGKQDFIFGGTDEERLVDFQQMLDDPSVSAILCARGGYGSIRILDKIDFSKFIAKPKWIVGFSDVTVLHSHINQNFKIASIHSKMCNSFPDELSLAEPGQIDSIISIHQALTGKRIDYPVAADPANRTGRAEGILTGGNLKTLESLSGTKSDILTRDKILFVEDTGEYLYSIDRMFYNLKRTGKLDHLAGLIIGGFKIRNDDVGEEFGKSLYNIVLEQVNAFSYPVCFNFPVGHQKTNYALTCGSRYILSVSPTEVSFKES